MKRGFLALLLMSAPAVFTVEVCLGRSSVHQKTPKVHRSIKVRKVRLSFIGYLVLPEGYRAYQTKDLRDAWYGYIASRKTSFRIRYSAGLVQTPFNTDENKFVWLKQESIPKGTLKYGLLRTNEGEEMAATVGFVNFYAPVNTDSDMKLFLEIVRSYRVEQCPDCERALPE